MSVLLVNVGFDNVIAANRIVAIVGPASAPVRRMIHEAAGRGMIIDMTSGRKTKAVIVLDSGHVALAALQPATITGRLQTRSQALAISAGTDEDNTNGRT